MGKDSGTWQGFETKKNEKMLVGIISQVDPISAMRQKHLILSLSIAATTAIPVSGANLLLNNANFELGGANYQSGNGISTSTPGWVVNFSPGDFGTATDQAGIGATRFAIAGGTTRWETTVADRATVTASTDYTFSYSARNDGSMVTAFVFVDWFDTAAALVSSSANFAGDFVATSSTGGDPFGNYTRTITAPAGATAAGVRWGTTAGVIIADNFFLDVVPEPSSALLGALGVITLLVRRRRA